MSAYKVLLLISFYAFLASGRELPLEKRTTTKATDLQEASVPPSAPILPKEGTAGDVDDKNSLAAALQDIERRKREITGSYKPYSAFAGAHRYRYPLYRKRSSYYPSDYYDDDPYLNDKDYSYDDYFAEEKPSMFRERERGPVQKLIDNAYFSSKPLTYKRTLHSASLSSLKKKNKSPYNLEDSPYDLAAIGKLYEKGKRARYTPTRSRNLDSSNRFLETLSAMNSDLENGGTLPDNPEEYSDMLKHAIEAYAREGPVQNTMIRRKRASLPSSKDSNQPKNGTSNKPHLNHLTKVHSKHESKRSKFNPHSEQSERQKRAYVDSSNYYDPMEAENDLLTRIYFKTLAQSVGDKRKRMAFAKFEAQKKRSNAFDSLLENPEMLHYIQEQIKDAEEEIAKEAESEIEENSSSISNREDDSYRTIMSNNIGRLSALERMREALYQLERLEEREVVRKRAQSLVSGVEEEEEEEEPPRSLDSEKKKRRKALKERLLEAEQRDDRLMEAGQKEEEEERYKRKEEALRSLFKGNTRDECPVLERIVMNCASVADMVEDDSMLFMEPCMRHEICYMCGSGLDATRHECDALLSSALEASCNEAYVIPDPGRGSLECLGAAGETYNILSDPSRYDDKGTCTYDPCVRQLLDSR